MTANRAQNEAIAKLRSAVSDVEALLRGASHDANIAWQLNAPAPSPAEPAPSDTTPGDAAGADGPEWEPPELFVLPPERNEKGDNPLIFAARDAASQWTDGAPEACIRYIPASRHEREMAEVHKALIVARQDLTIERQALAAAESRLRAAEGERDEARRERDEVVDGMLRAALERDDALAKVARPRWRREVASFADAMERKLRANDHKGGWSECDPEWLMSRLLEEAKELRDVLDLSGGKASRYYPIDPNGPKWHERVLSEAADVANFAMMIADRSGALTGATDRGTCGKCGGTRRVPNGYGSGEDDREVPMYKPCDACADDGKEPKP